MVFYRLNFHCPKHYLYLIKLQVTCKYLISWSCFMKLKKKKNETQPDHFASYFILIDISKIIFFTISFPKQTEYTSIPPHQLTHRTCYSSSYYLYFYTLQDFENFNIVMLWLKTLSLYLFFGFWSLSYGYQLQQDDFLIQSFNPNPSGRTTEEWKGVPETFFPLSYSL